MNVAMPAASIPGFRSDTVTVNGVRLHYWLGSDPQGQPVILWHGFLSTGYAWREVAPVLADSGLSIGHGYPAVGGAKSHQYSLTLGSGFLSRTFAASATRTSRTAPRATTRALWPRRRVR